MGSSKPPNYDLPFGYSFDTTSSAAPFLPSPPVPAPGPSLLDDNDTKFLDNFFDGVSSDQFNGDFFANAGENINEFGFGWQEPPQAFMGSTSSFSQEPLLPASEMPSANYSGTSGPISMQQSEQAPDTTADVLAAATLLQNGHPSRSQRLGNETLFANQDVSVPVPSQTNSQSLMAYNPLRTRQIPSKQEEYIRDTYYAEMMFGPPASDGRPQPKAPPSPSKATDIHWGSDAGFRSGRGFVAPPGQASVKDIEQNMMHVVECLEAQVNTASSTHPSSPIVSCRESVRRSIAKDTIDNDEQDGSDSRPRRRKKSKTKSEENDEDAGDEDGVVLKSPRKRRPKPTNHPSATQSSSPAKRRKSTASSATKHPRENLTEDQKRENHIRSEQKRRTLIKEGFDDLGELVPDLREGGHSKSAALVMAADWLEDLINGNELLRARLQELEQGKM